MRRSQRLHGDVGVPGRRLRRRRRGPVRDADRRLSRDAELQPDVGRVPSAAGARGRHGVRPSGAVVCTRDVCEGDHRCTNPPVDGTCWSLKGTATFTATAFDASCSCEARAVPLPLALLADGTFARAGGIAQCGAIVPEEVGTAKRVARGRTKLTTTNLAAVRELCIAPPQLLERRAWVKTNRSRSRLRGLQVERISLEDSPIDLTTAIRFRGQPTSSGTSEGASVSLGRCAQQLIDCLIDKLSP
jgi:hypothetical protein